MRNGVEKRVGGTGGAEINYGEVGKVEWHVRVTSAKPIFRPISKFGPSKLVART